MVGSPTGFGTNSTYFLLWPDGANSNGGAYCPALSGGVDLTPTTGAYFYRNDFSIVGNEITLTCLTSTFVLFTTTCIGNGIGLNGNSAANSLVTGTYFVTSIVAANMATVDRVVSSVTVTSITGTLGGALRAFTSLWMDRSLHVGNYIWVKGPGNYSLTMTQVGTSTGTNTNTAYGFFQGYKDVFWDNPQGTDRPKFYVNQYGPGFRSHTIHANIEIAIFNAVYGWGAAVNSSTQIYINCKVNQLTVLSTSGYPKGFSNDYSVMIGCEAICSQGVAFFSVSNQTTIRYMCFAHDSSVGFAHSGTSGLNSHIINSCIIKDCSIGVVLANNSMVINSTLYNTTPNSSVAITNYGQNSIPVMLSTSAMGGKVINNIITGFNYGIVDYQTTPALFVENNLYYNNGTNLKNVKGGDWEVVDQDPLLANPANNDFSLLSGSAALAKGYQIVDIGLTNSTTWNIGFAQNSVAIVLSGTAYEYTWSFA